MRSSRGAHSPEAPTRFEMPVPRRPPFRRTASAVFALAVAGCGGDSGSNHYKTPRDADQAMVRLTTEITADGRRALRLEADSAFLRTESPTAMLMDVRATMLSSTGSAVLTIVADSATMEIGTQRLTALGEAVARRLDQRIVVRTAALTYDPSTDKLTSDTITEVESGGSTQSGSCFESDALLTDWSLCSGPS